MNETPITLRSLACERDDRLLFAGLDLDIRWGDVVQIEGPNGSGKTTLLRILTTHSRDFEGDIFWMDQPVRKVEHEYRSHILFLGHLSGVKEALTPRQNLSWYQQLFRCRTDRSVESCLSGVGLAGYEDVPCSNLSAGQKRRVGLARLSLSDAPVWILDEPFTAIDKAGVQQLEALIADHCTAGGIAILTTHQELGLSNLRRVNLLDFKPARGTLDGDA